MLAPGTELIVDGGIRQKKQQAGFFSAFGPDFDSYVDTTLTTLSLTPRLSQQSQHRRRAPASCSPASTSTTRSTGRTARSIAATRPIHHYDLRQLTAAAYAMETIGVAARYRSSASASACSEYPSRRATSSIPIAPGGFVRRRPRACRSTATRPSRPGTSALNTASISISRCSARMAQSFRVPNVDERVGHGAVRHRRPISISRRRPRATMKPDFGFASAASSCRSSAYLMNLQNEIFFSPATFTNINLDPTRRYGVETIASWQVTQTLRFKVGFAYTRAIFVEGPFAGNDVPLVRAGRRTSACPGTSTASSWCSTRSPASSARAAWTTTRRTCSS